MHKDAENKVKYVFCAQDKAKAYEEAMTGKLDDMKYEVCTKPEISDLLKVHKDTAAKLGISGTPSYCKQSGHIRSKFSKDRGCP